MTDTLSPPTTDSEAPGRERWDAGVMPYAEMGYWNPDYVPEPSDILAACRVTEILLQVMENQREDIVVVLAGYRDRMDTFFQSNPGMHSRIAHHIDLPAYSLEELLAIGELMLTEERYELSDSARRAFTEYPSRRMHQPRFSNARSVRNALERARLRHANRLLTLQGPATLTDLTRLEAEHFLASRVSAPTAQEAEESAAQRLEEAPRTGEAGADRVPEGTAAGHQATS